MVLNRIFNLKSIVDFTYMFVTNILKKGFGFIREVILAFLFGSSLIYSFYILLRTAADILSQFTFGNALEANLLPKLSKHFANYNQVSYNKLFDFTKRVLIYIFIISECVQLIIIWQLNSQYTYHLIIISFLLSLLIVFNFFNSIFLTVLKAEGRFKDYSLGSTLNLFISTILVYPLAFFLNISGIVISRIIGVLVLTRQYILPILKRKRANELDISRHDFSLSILLLGNFPSLILLSSRFLSGTDGDNNIAFFNYAIVLLNVILTAVIANINTLTLRKISISKEIRWVGYSLLVALISSLCLYIVSANFSVPLIEFIYERGAFTNTDVLETASYFKQMTIAIIILLISSVLQQPYFTLDMEIRKKYSNSLSLWILLPFIITLILIYFNDWDAKQRSLIMLYVMSFVSLILSFFTCYKYFKDES